MLAVRMVGQYSGQEQTIRACCAHRSYSSECSMAMRKTMDEPCRSISDVRPSSCVTTRSYIRLALLTGNGMRWAGQKHGDQRAVVAPLLIAVGVGVGVRVAAEVQRTSDSPLHTRIGLSRPPADSGRAFS